MSKPVPKESFAIEGFTPSALFVDPDAAVCCTIQELLNALPVIPCPFEDDQFVDMSEAEVIKESDIMGILKDMLKQDADGNASECREWGGSFGYGVGFSSDPKNCELQKFDVLYLWCRLFDSEGNSQISYISKVYRSSPQEYTLLEW